MNSFVFTQSSNGLPVLGYKFGIQGPEVLILGGVHGDETEGIWAAQALLQKLMSSFSFKLCLTLVPMFNIDGILQKSRTNARGVDLNRNLPTKDWSSFIKEPRYNPGPSPLSEEENKGLVEYIQNKSPKAIMSLHSWHPCLNVNGDCFQLAQVISAQTGYRIDTDIGYPTPGCLGTYAGHERGSSTLTYEIERGLDVASVIRVHVPAIIEGLKFLEKS